MAIVQSDGVLVDSSPSVWRGRLGGGSLGGGVTWFNGRTADYAAIYRTQPNLRLVVNFLARNIAQLGLKPYERISDVERRSLGDHELGKMIRVPNPMVKMTRYRFIHSLVSDLGIFDMAFFLRTRNEVNGKLRLWRLPPNLMEPIEGNIWNATRWRFLGVGSQPEFSDDDLFISKGYNPDDFRMGLSPIESIRQILAEGQAASEYREQFWKGGARISGVIERPASGAGTPRWSEEAKKRFLTDWRSEFTGAAAQAGGVPLLEDGMKFVNMAFSAKDSEYLGARRLSREEVASMYHVSPLFVGILENANYNNVKEQHRHLYQDTLGPTLKMLEEDFWLQLVPEFPDLDFDTTYLEFDLSDKLRGSFEEEAAATQTAVGRPWKTANEARARDNMAPIEGGDELVTPLNVLIGGQASATDSAPDGTNSIPSFDYFVPISQLPKALAGREPAALSTGSKTLTKDSSELPEDVADWFDTHVEMLTATFDRQKNAVVAALGGGASIESIWDEARWNGELKADFMELAQGMGTELGQAAADAFDGTFDPDLMDEYLTENTRIASENVNYTTKTQLSNLDGDDESFLDNVRNVFAVASGSRAAQIAISRVTAVGNFAKTEGSYQGGATKKVWNVRSSRSRHPGLDGQKVDIDAEFSNGARWPGDHSLSEDDRAGCVCGLDFE